MRLPGRRPRIGVALSTEMLVGALAGSATRPERVEVPEPVGDGGVEEALGEAFRRLRARLETTHGRSMEGAEVAAALLPPLADTRLLTLPPVRPRELEAVVRRDASRHFIGVDAPRVVGVKPVRRRRSGPAPVLAAAASARFLEALRRAVSEVEWRLDSVAPAQAAWLAGGVRGRGADGLVVAVARATAHVLRLEKGAPVSLRRVPLDLPDELDAATGTGEGAAVVFGEGPGLRTAVEAVKRTGWVVPPAGGAADERPDAAEAAARHAGNAELELVPPSLVAERADRARGRAVRMAGVAAVLLVAAAGVHLWGARQELDTTRAQRAAIREQVAPVVAARDSLDALDARMAAIDDVIGRSPRWTRALYELALLLPRDAHLTSLVASEESVEIEAEAGRAGAAVQALRQAEHLTDVQLLGLVERELEDGETVVERFRVEARLAPPGDPPEGDPGTTGAAPGGPVPQTGSPGGEAADGRRSAPEARGTEPAGRGPGSPGSDGPVGGDGGSS